MPRRRIPVENATAPAPAPVIEDAAASADGDAPVAAASARPQPSPQAAVVAVTVIAAVISIALCLYWFKVVVPAPDPNAKPSGDLISTVYDPPKSSVEEALDRGDGQLFAAEATDPLVRNPEQVRGGPDEQAYRYQRPLYGWLGWGLSGGRSSAVAWALVALTAASVILLINLCARWLAATGADPRWALALIATPGVFVDLTWVGPEALGVALAVFGLHRWFGVGRSDGADPPGGAGGAADEDGRSVVGDLLPHAAADGLVPGEGRLVPASVDWVAVAAFAAAGLCRESMLLVPVVLGIAALVRRSWPVVLGVAMSALPYVAWVLVLHQRIGAWPKGAVSGRISGVPLGGLASAVGSWGAGDVVFAVAIVALAVAALVVARTSPLRPLIAVHLLFAAFLGEPVWIRFADFGRVLLPLTVFSMLALMPALAARRQPASTAPASAAPAPA